MAKLNLQRVLLPIFAFGLSSTASYAETLILKASTIITMDQKKPRAEAIAFDTATGRITAIGTLADVSKASPDAKVRDLGTRVLMPGFIDPHNHPMLSGLVTQEPAYWLAPYVGYKTWNDVKAKIRKADAEAPAGVPLIFQGVDRLLQQAPLPTRMILDPLVGKNRPLLVTDNSGHAVYFSTAVVRLLGWKDAKPPADPLGGSFGRNKDGTSNGVANEVPAVLTVVGPILPKAIPNPLLSSARFSAYMSSMGITSTSEHTYDKGMYKGYLALSSVPDTPLRFHDAREKTRPARSNYSAGTREHIVTLFFNSAEFQTQALSSTDVN